MSYTLVHFIVNKHRFETRWMYAKYENKLQIQFAVRAASYTIEFRNNTLRHNMALPKNIYRQTSNISRAIAIKLLITQMLLEHRCSNYIFTLDLIPCFNGLGKNNCKTRRETFKFWDMMRLTLEVWRYNKFAAYPTAVGSPVNLSGRKKSHFGGSSETATGMLIFTGQSHCSEMVQLMCKTIVSRRSYRNTFL